VVLDPDNLPGDNRSDAAVVVTDALPALLVDGDPHRDPIRSESFFARAALSASENDTPLVRAAVVPIRDFDPAKLAAPGAAAIENRKSQIENPSVVVLANVETLTADQVEALENFVTEGGGLLVALGDNVNTDDYNRLLFATGDGMLPASLRDIRADDGPNALGTHVTDGSLTVPFMAPFRTDRGGTLTETRFSRWWRVDEAKVKRAADEGEPRRPLTPNPSPPVGRGEKGIGDRKASDTPPRRSPAESLARFDTNDPFLLGRDFGRGRVVLMTTPLDSDWSTLPAKADFVPLLHELLFHLAGSAAASRNLETGEPLVLAVLPDVADQVQSLTFIGPGKKEFAPQRGGDDERPALRLDDTHVPGVYVLQRKPDVAPPPAVAAMRNEHFVVNFDRAESDLTLLDNSQEAKLTGNERLKFVQDFDGLQTRLAGDAPKSEVWQLVMLFILALLAGELWLTRRLVQGGHVVVEG
jgi:hypothetical protein